MRTVAIVQARMNSTRLPRKVLKRLPLPGNPTVLEEVVERCWQIPSVNLVVLAVPDHPESQELVDAVVGARTIYGPELDVLTRFYIAAIETRAKVIVRVTSDCPLIDPLLCEQVIQYRAKHALEYAYNNMPTKEHPEGTFPKGLDCEAFTMDALAYETTVSRDPLTREHVTYGLRRQAAGTPMPTNPAGDYSHLRWTLDTAADYETICAACADPETKRLVERFRG